MKVKNLLIAGGVPIPALDGLTISGRRIRAIDENGLGSLTCNNQIVMGRLSPSMDEILVPVGETVLLSAININCAEPNGEIDLPLFPGNKKISLLDNGVEGDSANNDGMYSKEWIAERTGRYEFIFPGNDKVVVKVYDPATMGTYVKHDEPDFLYRQIAGTPLEAFDDWSTTIDTPFPIHFGSLTQGFDRITIGSNGAISLTDAKSFSMSNQKLPAEGHTSVIAPFWDDLNPDSSDGDIFYDTLGEAPNREFVVEWRDVRHYNSPDSGTFQVVFFENNADILFNYLDVDFGSEDINDGASATVGIQTTTDKLLEVSFDSPTLASNKAFRFTVAEGGDETLPEMPQP